MSIKSLAKILKVVEGWNIGKPPEFRAFKCGRCLINVKKAWHIWFDYKGFKCEVHLCKRCFKKLKLDKKEKI